MEIAITLPDEIADQIGSRWHDIPRRTLEALVAQACRDGIVTGPQAQQMLGIDSRLALDAFLKQAGVQLEYSEKDLEADAKALELLLRHSNES